MNDRLEELRMIEKRNGGVLHPEAVVEFARNPKTSLHSAFEWDDSQAAEQYRIEQARRLIRVIVDVIPNHAEPVKAFVAIRTERYEEGGYRHMPTLLKSEKGRSDVLETALWELKAIREKYRELKELAEVFSAIEKVRRT
jgi:hypothetical protein